MREAKHSKRSQNVECQAKEHILPVVGRVPMDEIEQKHLSSIVKRMQGMTTQRGTPPSAWYITMAAGILTTMMRDASENWMVDAEGKAWRLDRVPTFEGVVLPRISKKPIESLTKEQMAEFMTALHAVRYGGVIAFMVMLGLRSQEARLLRWSQLDINPERYAPAAGLLRYAPDDRKEGATCEVPVPHEILRYLPTRKEGEDFVWRLCKNDAVARDLKAALIVANIQKKVTPHGLRHTYAQLLHDAGVSIEDIRAQLNHADIKTTQGYLAGAHTTARKSKIVADHARRVMMGV